jgi:nicotinate dehydrogenase subunit B
MSTLQPTEFFPITEPRELEAERYEFDAPLPYRFDLDRRRFFGKLGSGILVLFLVEAALAQQQQQQLETGAAPRRGGRGGGVPADIGAWLHISEDGTVTVFTGKAEVGQNIRTSLAQAVAEELRVPVSSIKMVMADTDLTPYDQGTFGSQSTPQMASRLHRVAAAAREALLDLAAESLKADRASLTVADGKIVRTGGSETATFGQLTKGQKLVKTVDNNSPTTAPKDWKIAGTSVPKVNGRDLVTGKHKYASDMNLPGMLHGKVLRPPAYGATLASLDTKEAEAMPGVVVVHDGDFVGVAAPDTMIAQQAIDSMKAEWSKPEPKTSSTEIYAYLKKNATAGGGRGGGGRGGGAGAGTPTVDEGLAQADHKFEQSYNIAYIAHVPLEPRAALAEWKDGKLTLWTGTQSPFGVQNQLVQALGLSTDKVRVIVPDTGSGYGGKHQERTAIEAARLAKAAGKPVKLVWTRQEEFCWSYARPAGVIEIKSGVKNDGTITAWEFHNYYSGPSAIDSPYEIPFKRSQPHGLAQGAAPLETGSYRGLAATANNFAREVHMDELARAVKMDPLEFRLKNCKNDRLRAVLEAAAKAFGWGKDKPAADHGYGIAGGTEKGSFVATCVEVAIDRDSGGVKLRRAVTAFECGAIVNPDHLKNQVEGAVVMGIGGALFEAIDFKDGMITNPLLSDYRVPRFADMPKLETVLLDRKDIPSAGAGETPIIGIAPAIGNAICDATGIRLRNMPMVPEGLNLAEAKKG